MTEQIGAFRGRELFQKSGSIGGSRNVFVLQGIKNELVYPPFGGVIRNPFRGKAKMFAGDLCEYRTNANGVKPEIYMLKTFKVAKATSAATTVYLERGKFSHIPFAGDCIMIAPNEVGGTGTATRITATLATTAVNAGGNTVDVWACTVIANVTVSEGDIMVESETFTELTNQTKAMLVKNTNAIFDCDCDFFDNPSFTFGSVDGEGDPNDTNFSDARYFYAPALGGVMFTSKMSPMPQCVLNLNRCNVNGWFKIDYYDMNSELTTAAFSQHLRYMTAKPTTATVGSVGDIAIVNSSTAADCGVWVLSSVSGTTYTWTQVSQMNE